MDVRLSSPPSAISIIPTHENLGKTWQRRQQQRIKMPQRTFSNLSSVFFTLNDANDLKLRLRFHFIDYKRLTRARRRRGRSFIGFDNI